MLRCEARDEGRSQDYDAEERNDAEGHFSRKPGRGAAFRAICFVARLANVHPPFGAARFAHLIPESWRRGPEGFFNSLLIRGPSPGPMERFLERFVGRMVIVHAGLSPGWLRELERERGARGMFRFDVRRRHRRRPAPMESVIFGQVLPRGLPLPLLMRVEHDGLRLRHLTRGGHPVHPSEVAAILAELDSRYHLWLRMRGHHLAPQTGIPPADNRVFFEV